MEIKELQTKEEILSIIIEHWLYNYETTLPPMFHGTDFSLWIIFMDDIQSTTKQVVPDENKKGTGLPVPF